MHCPIRAVPWPGTVRLHLIWPASLAHEAGLLLSPSSIGTSIAIYNSGRAEAFRPPSIFHRRRCLRRGGCSARFYDRKTAQPAIGVISFRLEINAPIVFSTSCGTSALYGPLI